MKAGSTDCIYGRITLCIPIRQKKKKKKKKKKIQMFPIGQRFFYEFLIGKHRDTEEKLSIFKPYNFFLFSGLFEKKI